MYPLQGWTADKIASEIKIWDALPTLGLPSACRRVYILADDELVVPGPRVPAAIELIARTLHPETFRTQQASGLRPQAARSPIQLFSYSVIQLLQ